MATSIAKMTAARSFVRSLNILLKFVRLYGFDHVRAAEQFQNAWSDLRAAIPAGDDSGLLLGTSGSQLILDGAPIEAAHAERSFAQLLSAAGLASIHFLPRVTQEDLAQFIRAFPAGNAKPASLAEQLKTALAGTSGIRINELRFFAEDSSTTEVRMAASLTVKTLGADANQVANWLSDPQKLLQLIAASEGSRGGPAAPGSAGDPAAETAPNGRAGNAGGSPGTAAPPSAQPGAAGLSSPGPRDGTLVAIPFGTESSAGTAGTRAAISSAASGFASAATSGSASGSASGSTSGSTSGASPGAASAMKDDEILAVLRLVSRLGEVSGARGAGGELALAPGPFQQEISNLSGQSRDVLHQAVAALAARAPALRPNDPMLLQLAEHLAIRFALDRYERGEVRVNAVREMIERMTKEISGLRKVLGSHEETLAQAGIAVESHADTLDRQFWASVPEANKRAVLISADAWCIPPRNVRQYVDELRRRGDHDTATSVLESFASAVGQTDPTARKRAAMGLSDLADLYATHDGTALGYAIRSAGLQLAVERDAEIQDVISAAFVRLAQEAAAKDRYRAILQSLDSLDSIERQRPSFAQGVRPRLGVEKHLPDFIEEALKSDPRADGLLEVIARVPRLASEYLVNRFNRSSQRTLCERIAALAQALGAEIGASLRECLQAGPPNEAAESVGLLSCLNAISTEKWLGDRLRDWPRSSQDRALRLLARGGTAQRGWLLLSLFDRLDPLLRPLAVDEIGMSGDVSAIAMLLDIAAANSTEIGPYLRLKAVEALGRLRAPAAVPLLRDIAEAKKHWRWIHPFELRLAAFQAIAVILPLWAQAFFPHSGFTIADLDLGPLDHTGNTARFRERRYPRLSLKVPLPASATSQRETIALEIRALSLSGGRAHCEKHVSPGTLVALKIGNGLRPIRAQAFLRDARAQGIGFEFVEIDLDERARLRRLLRENGIVSVPAPAPAQQPTPSEVESNTPVLVVTRR
jgi:PilZ domain